MTAGASAEGPTAAAAAARPPIAANRRRSLARPPKSRAVAPVESAGGAEAVKEQDRRARTVCLRRPHERGRAVVEVDVPTVRYAGDRHRREPPGERSTVRRRPPRRDPAASQCRRLAVEP